MGFDRAVNGGNDLFGESISLINFIKFFEFCLCFFLADNLSLLIFLCLYGLYVSLLNGRQHSSLSSSSKLQLQGFTQTAVQINRQVLNDSNSSYSFLVLFMFFPPCSG